jgi:hypothetical protein
MIKIAKLRPFAHRPVSGRRRPHHSVYNAVDGKDLDMATDPLNDPTADPCSGCGGNCSSETPGECRGPAPLPWLDPHRCMFFYEGRVFAADRFNDRLRRWSCA